jgi:hypothetical protein
MARLTLALSLPAALLALAACDRDAIYNERSVSDAIYDSYAPCSESEIRWLTSKHNLQTVFEKCGSNNFTGFTWSPDGVHLFFQLPLTAHIINGEEKTITTLPTENPIGGVAWLDKDRLALPLGPEEGGEINRLAVYDRARVTVEMMKLDVVDPDTFQTAGDGKRVYLVAGEEGKRRVYVADTAARTVEPALDWLPAFDTFTYAPVVDLVAYGVGDQTTIARAADGEVVYRFDDTTRAVVHPEGRYIALETLGEPITPYDQKAWDELSPEAREREQRRTEEWLARQPDWVPKEVQPPTIDIVDTTDGARYRATAFYGNHFEWYPEYNYYCSFILWGVEGKELNANVVLTNLAERLRMLDAGETPLGFARLGGSEEVAPSDGEASDEPATGEPAEPADAEDGAQ